MTPNDLTDRIDRLEARFDGPLGASDLPDGHTAPVRYFTDEEGEWDDLKYARLLLEVRGPAGPAWVALRELEALEDGLDALETAYLRLWNRTGVESESGTAWQEERRVASQIESGEYLNRRVFDSIRSQLVTLGLEAGPLIRGRRRRDE